MKKQALVWSIVIATVMSTMPCLSQVKLLSVQDSGLVDSGPSPKVEFATPLFEFGRVESGQLIQHDYIFTNIGNALLEITAVRPSCGCTTAGEWDKQVEPGKTGKIPVRFNTAGYG